MPTFNVTVIREAGYDPITNERLGEAREELTIEAIDEASAFTESRSRSTLAFRGQVRRTLVDGKEYLDPRF